MWPLSSAPEHPYRLDPANPGHPRPVEPAPTDATVGDLRAPSLNDQD